MEYLCNNCPRLCNVVRSVAGRGYCKMGAEPVVARAALHFDEEPVISGNGGSGTVFFSGCALRCKYCQNYSVSQEGLGRRISVDALRHIYADLIAQGAHNINLVNPTHFLEPIFASLQNELPVPVVWNSGGYERVETIQRLAGRVQVYLPDLKYYTRKSAKAYSDAADYFSVASAAILEMHRQVGPVQIGKSGVIEGGVIVRHLILPGLTEESKKILTWISENLPGTWVSLMAQYLPMGKAAEIPELSRRLTEEEYESVVEHMLALGLEDGFVQELSSAEETYIPKFDLTGVPKECST